MLATCFLPLMVSCQSGVLIRSDLQLSAVPTSDPYANVDTSLSFTVLLIPPRPVYHTDPGSLLIGASPLPLAVFFLTPMAAAVYLTAKVPASNPFHMVTHQRVNVDTSISNPQPSSSRSPSSSPSPPESSSKAFGRLRSSLEHSIRTATRSKKPLSPPADDFATITARNSKGKGKATIDVPKEKERPRMLRRLESKVGFRRASQETAVPVPIPSFAASNSDDAERKVRAAGFTSFTTPSMRQGSMSSPALHLSSQALPSPKSQPAVPVSSSSNSTALISPPRERTRRTTVHPSQVSSPVPLAPKREVKSNGQASPSLNPLSREPTSRHRSTKSTPPALSPLPPTPTFQSSAQRDLTSSPETPSPRTRGCPSPPESPTPMSGSRTQLTRNPSKTAAMSSGHLPLHSPPPSPLAPRASSPPVRSSSRTRVTPSQRGMSSNSTSHLPITPSSPSPTPRRPSIDAPRRPSIDIRRPSAGSPIGSREDSPSPVRARPISPAQRTYAQNRHFNMSTASLAAPANPEQREAIRAATSMLCKEILKLPPHMSKTESGIKDWEEVEMRMRALARLERVWGKSGVNIGSSSNISTVSASGGAGTSGEERERRLFCDALRDGFVLCQLMNKLRSSSVVRPDAREDGYVRTANITKFLAACSSYGIPDEDLFQHDDLIEGTGESLARVARTIVALIKFVDSPKVERSKFISGGQASKATGGSSPYHQGTYSRAATSTPNLSRTQGSTSPSPTSPGGRKRWSPPADLPTVRSNSPSEFTEMVETEQEAEDEDRHIRDDIPLRDVPQLKTPPPPRSPLRVRSQKRLDDDGGLFTWAKNNSSPARSSVADSTRASIGDDSVRDSIAEYNNIRQSVASSAMTDTTVATQVSSILDVHQSSGFNKFATIRTMTTDMTSEGPSIGRAEGSIIADDLARKRGSDGGGKLTRDRKTSEAHGVDLTRVAEEGDESGSSSRDNVRDEGKAQVAGQGRAVQTPEKPPAVHLHKGKWPDDFLDAFQSQVQARPIASKSPSPGGMDRSQSASPISISPPRKLAVVGPPRRDETVDALPQFPRRPSHRVRHSVDSGSPALLPKESYILRRDASPDSAPSSNRVILRRHSTKQGGTRNGTYLPRSNLEEHKGSDNGSLVPFPQAASREPSPGSPSPPSSGDDLNDKPRLHRGRFQSDIEGSNTRKGARPSSYDELGGKPVRTRFESMVNLGVASGNASASDLLSRESQDGSAVRKTVIVREEGKPPTHFQLGNCIGRGQFGSVYRALNLNTGQMVAVKRIRLEGLKEDEVTTLMREVDLVKSLSHPSIVKYEGMARDDDTLSIVLEYAENGSLGQTLKAFGKLNERLVASYVVKILEGLHYLHRSDVVHCDLKAANILTTKNGNVKLSDFGVSLNLRAMEREIKDVAGTPNWMAPEVIELKGASTKSDIWSLACTVIELLTGRPPYADIANSMSVMFRIVEDDMPPIPEGCTPLLEDFLTRCFNKDPTKRPSADLLCEHPWLKKNWGAHKELRPQDSIPFLRRVSADLQKSEVARYLSHVEMPDQAEGVRTDDAVSASPQVNRRPSATSFLPTADNDISPREHSFVKTTFSKPMICRVCLLNVKKSAVLCAQCSLIAHSKCAANAPPTCDLRAQLLLYAQFAEKGNPGSVYYNPLDVLNEVHPSSPVSDVSYVAHSPRTSLDGPPTPHSPNSAQAPGAFKFMGAFKRSRSNLSPEPVPPPAPSSSAPSNHVVIGDEIMARRRTITNAKQPKERPLSTTSNSTDGNTGSLRSAATAAESFSSRQATSRKSRLSSNGTDKGTRTSAGGLSVTGGPEANTSSKITTTSRPPDDQDDSRSLGVPGALPPDSRRHRKREAKSSGNCIVQ